MQKEQNDELENVITGVIENFDAESETDVIESKVVVNGHDYDLSGFKSTQRGLFKTEVKILNKESGTKETEDGINELWYHLGNYRQARKRADNKQLIKMAGNITQYYANRKCFRIVEKEETKVLSIDSEGREHIIKAEFFEMNNPQPTVKIGNNFYPYSRVWLHMTQDSKTDPVYYSEYRPDLPCGENPTLGIFNTYRGFAIEPKNTGVNIEPLYTHLKEKWCNGDMAQYEWLLNWFAWKAQTPDIKPGTAVVLSSKPGLGKNIILSMFESIYGIDQIYVTQVDDSEKRFMSQLIGKQMVVFNEGGYDHSKKSYGTLKSWITDKYLSIERKGIDQISTTPTYFSVMFITNEEWAVRIEANDRRFTVLTPSEHVGNDEYFNNLAACIERGKAQFLYDLLHRDVSQFNPRVCLETSAKQKQRECSLNSFQRFWLDATEELVEIVAGVKVELFDPWDRPIVKQELYRIYTDYAKRSQMWGVVSMATFFSRMQDLKPLIQDAQITMDGKRTMCLGCHRVVI
ncbi:hypothetical protein FACS1894147_00890 [Spirochaetia bacterium]|nr:hypothetical protein FACS1894147_00890 [Spirochaetia bacterium]